MPLISRRAALVAATESIKGTADALSLVTALPTVVRDVTVQTAPEVIERPLQGSFGYAVHAFGLRTATATFSCELVGNGDGTAPVWMETLLPACGLPQTAEAFNADSDPANADTVTLAFYLDGKRKVMYGAAGTFDMVCDTGRPVRFDFTFEGIWDGETDQTLLATTAARLPIRFAGAVPSLGSWSIPCAQSLTLSLGNEIYVRECQQNSTTGLNYAVITNRKSTITVNPESQLVATNSTYADWLNSTLGDFSMVLSDSDEEVTVSASDACVESISHGDRNGVAIDDMTIGILTDDLEFVWAQ